MQNTLAFDTVKNPLLLISRLLMMVLFINFGAQKLLDYSATVGYFVHQGVPLPYVATPIAIIMELGVEIAIALGLFVRPLAILLAMYTLATGLLGACRSEQFCGRISRQRAHVDSNPSPRGAFPQRMADLFMTRS